MRAMRNAAAFILSFTLIAGPALAVDGNLGVLQRGQYLCERPGGISFDEWRIREPEKDFSVISGSRYETPDGVGIYLRTSDEVLFTSGPLKGAKFRMKNESFLRILGPDGSPNGKRCVRKRISDE